MATSEPCVHASNKKKIKKNTRSAGFCTSSVQDIIWFLVDATEVGTE
jgi:hypothetical protein